MGGSGNGSEDGGWRNSYDRSGCGKVDGRGFSHAHSERVIRLGDQVKKKGTRRL